jgi:hypothetical protein
MLKASIISLFLNKYLASLIFRIMTAFELNPKISGVKAFNSLFNFSIIDL